MRFISAVALSLVTAAPAVAADPVDGKLPPDRPPSTMTSTEIRAYNAGLQASHPYFIRCKKTEVIGSLAKKLRVCRTNQEWAQYAEQGQQNARETWEDASKAPINSSN